MIIIGKEGGNIKKIGEIARKDLEKIFKKKINLFLFVKLKKDWVSNPNNYKFFGMDMNA